MRHIIHPYSAKLVTTSLCPSGHVRLALVSLICALGFSHAWAETNTVGVPIEIIGDNQTAGTTADPLQGLVENLNTDEAENAEVDLWARIKGGYAMPDIESEYTSNHESWYASRPDYVKRMMERSQKYLYYIVQEVEKRGMPSEIALLPMIESAYNPQAYSRSRASGIWQFVPATGKDFGLKQNWWVDNRRDVTAATNAALTYLQKLHGMFGAWDLALAAYNAGEGTVSRAIERNRKQGLPTDYQSLDLPAETKNYVPKLQAIKNIVTEPEKYGLEIRGIPNRPYFTRVNAPDQIDAKLAAKLAEISYDEFIALNPSYNRPVITSGGTVRHLLLPTWAADRFAENLANYDKPLTNWQTYYVKRGERMDNIAKKFGIQTSQLRDVNDLPNRNKFHYPQTLLVPAKLGLARNKLLENEMVVAQTVSEEEPAVKTNAKRTISRAAYKSARLSHASSKKFRAKSRSATIKAKRSSTSNVKAHSRKRIR